MAFVAEQSAWEKPWRSNHYRGSCRCLWRDGESVREPNCRRKSLLCVPLCTPVPPVVKILKFRGNSRARAARKTPASPPPNRETFKTFPSARPAHALCERPVPTRFRSRISAATPPSIATTAPHTLSAETTDRHNESGKAAPVEESFPQETAETPPPNKVSEKVD